MNPRHMLRSLVGAAWLTGAACIGPALAEGTFDIPAGAHFNPQKLERITEFFKNEVADGKIPGAIVLISQHGKPVYYEKFGLRDVTTKQPMTDDTIFTVFSMSKPITSVAAMMLVDEGRLKLDDPVEKYIPSFATAKVGVELKAENGEKKLELVPLKSPITILDLMRHTSGITYGFYGDSLVRALYSNTLLYAGDFDNAEFADRIARLPMAEQPGTLWDYGHSTDVLGRVIEVVAGKSLLQFEKERLLDPLGMTATGFYITDPAKLPLLADTMPNDNKFSAGSIRNARRMLKWESGGGGMISTVTDFAKFSQMLLNGGSLDGSRIIGRKTLELMASDHLTPDIKIQGTLVSPGHSFGLGFSVRTQQGVAPFLGSVGQFFWSGMGGTFFWIDPKEELFAVFMSQGPGQREYTRTLVRNLVYAAVE